VFGPVLAFLGANISAGTTGGWLISSRGSLLKAPHLILGSIKQSFAVLFEIRNNNHHDPPVVQRRVAACVCACV